MVDTSPPTVADPLAASDSGKKRSAASAASCTSDKITPASATRALSSPETERILRIRRIESSSARPSASGVAPEIGRAHVCTPVTNAHLVCRLLLEKNKKTLYTFIH